MIVFSLKSSKFTEFRYETAGRALWFEETHCWDHALTDQEKNFLIHSPSMSEKEPGEAGNTLQELKLPVIKIHDGVVFSCYLRVECLPNDLSIFCP